MTARMARLPGYRVLAQTATRDCPVALHQRGPRYAITSCRHVLMTNEDTRSERALGRVAASLVQGIPRPRLLVGGLGMGFTLRSLLQWLPAGARVVVAELLPAVARWNKRYLGHLSGHPVTDPRVRLRIADVAALVDGNPTWDAIVLDVDNGPDWLVQKRNATLYGRRGLLRLLRSLRSSGLLMVWSADRHVPFERRLASMGLHWRRYRMVRGEDPSAAVLYAVKGHG
jgi:spermidine synthase